MAPFDCKYLTFYLIAIVMFAISFSSFTRYSQNKKNVNNSLKLKVKVTE